MPTNKVSTPVKASAAIYARAHDPRSRSKINAQHAMCRRYCEDMGYDPILVADDCGGSGRPLSERAGWQSIMHAAHRRAIDIVVCESLDRVARNPLDLLLAVEKLRRADVVLETPHGGPNSGPFGFLQSPKSINRFARRASRSNTTRH
jgi:DNA invertase Pin-like site-specific DNA recombinase